MLKWAVCLALALSGFAAPAIAQSLTAFTPLGNATLAASTSSANVALPVLGTEIITNTGTVTAYVKFGGTSVTAATTDTPIAPSQTVVFNSGINVDLAAITASSTATLTITSGSGWPNMAGGGGIGTGGAVNATITGPLGRNADAASVSTAWSTEDVAIAAGMAPSTGTPCATTTTAACTITGLLQLLTNTAAAPIQVGPTASPTALIQATASVPITFTAAGGPTQIIAANGSTKIYITHIDYVLSGAGTFALITGTGTNCGTNTVYLEGASSHPLSFAANGGESSGGGLGPIYITGAGGEVCAITTGAVDTSGHISYAQF